MVKSVLQRRLCALVAAIIVVVVGARHVSVGCGGDGPPIPEPRVRGAPDERTRLRGTVLDAGGRPLGAARVAVETGLADFETTTDAAGGFDLPLPTASPTARCVVVAPGHAIAVGKWVAVEPGRGADVGTIHFASPARIEGVVVDGSGAPVPWAWVEVDGSAVFGSDWHGIARLGGVRFVDCDPVSGRLTIDFLPPGTWRLVGRSVTHEVAEAVVVAPCLDVRLTATSFPDGPRLDIDALVWPPDMVSPHGEITAVTQTQTFRPERHGGSCMDAGFLRFRVTPPCTLVFDGDPWLRRAEIAITSVPHAPIRIRAEPRGDPTTGGDRAISGVVELNGVPLAWDDGSHATPPRGYRCTVEAIRHEGRNSEDAPPRIATTLTRPDGAFAFEGLLRGSYSLRAGVETSFSDPVDAPLGPEWMVSARHEPVRISMRSRADLEFEVRIPAAVRAAPDLRIEATAARWQTAFPCIVKGDRVVIRGVSPGHIDAAVRIRANGVWSRRVVVHAEAGSALPAAVFPHGRVLQGRVLANGAPVPGARVEIRAPNDADGGGDIVVTDVDGRFAVGGFDPSAPWTVGVRAGAGWGGASMWAGAAPVDLALFR